jgi:serine/threonine protein kinase
MEPAVSATLIQFEDRSSERTRDGVQALIHTAQALKELHAMGYAHRDLKPGNILRRPKHHDWTLIDFGCAARIGALPVCVR